MQSIEYTLYFGEVLYITFVFSCSTRFSSVIAQFVYSHGRQHFKGGSAHVVKLWLKMDDIRSGGLKSEDRLQDATCIIYTENNDLLMRYGRTIVVEGTLPTTKL